MYKILIVDDEYEIRNGLFKYFPWNEVGFDVVGQAGNGKEALDFILNNCVDVVLSDIIMPVMSGVELAEELYKLNKGIKVIFLSVHKDFEYAKKALEYGVKNYIVKSTKYNELVSVFSKLKNELDQENNRQIVGNNLNNKPQVVGELCYNEKIIAVIMKYVEHNLKDANLENAAEKVHMNVDYISRLFKQVTGQRFTDYVIMVKMKKAAQLLNNINYKTYEISEIVGYSNPKNFTRTFKSFFKKSPREYRNEVNTNESWKGPFL